MPAENGKGSHAQHISACDKIIPHSVNAVARVECSMLMESQRNPPLCPFYMKKKTSERRRKLTVKSTRARWRLFENFRKYEAVYARNVVLIRERPMRVWVRIALQPDLPCITLNHSKNICDTEQSFDIHNSYTGV